MSAGPHALIRDGAVLVTKLDDILESLGPLPADAHEPAPAQEVEEKPLTTTVELSERQARIIRELNHEPMNVDRLIERTGFDAAIVMQELTFLTLKGQVRRIDGQTFARKK